MSFEGFKKIDPADIGTIGFDPFNKIGKEWFLLTAGNKDGFNTMTASWGFGGVMWGKPCFITVVRPQRHTKTFLDKEEYFTVSFFEQEYKKALSYCGSHSGKDVDKVKETGLTPIVDEKTAAFGEASLIFVCRKAYVQSLNSESFIDKELDAQNYSAGDYHAGYVGIIEEIYMK